MNLSELTNLTLIYITVYENLNENKHGPKLNNGEALFKQIENCLKSQTNAPNTLIEYGAIKDYIFGLYKDSNVGCPKYTKNGAGEHYISSVRFSSLCKIIEDHILDSNNYIGNFKMPIGKSLGHDVISIDLLRITCGYILEVFQNSNIEIKETGGRMFTYYYDGSPFFYIKFGNKKLTVNFKSGLMAGEAYIEFESLT